MRQQSNQCGYALLTLLSGLGLAAFGFGLFLPQASLGQWQALTQDAFQLNRERSRLMEYSVDYVNLYGSSGAGPGHLPCPDTDLGQSRPGPNPPCGRGNFSDGLLPDGVTRHSKRTVFSDSLSNRSRYRVARPIVNNPSRPVSTSRWPTEHNFETDSKGYARLSRPSGQTRLLKQKQLEVPVLKWVRAWLVWQLLESSLSYCHKQLPHASVAPDVEEQSQRLTGNRLLATCPLNVASESSQQLINASIIESCTTGLSPCVLIGHNALSWLINESDEMWEDSALYNHWFLKNQWIDSLIINAHIECISRSADCLLLMKTSEQNLSFSLLPDFTINASI